MLCLLLFEFRKIIGYPPLDIVSLRLVGMTRYSSASVVSWQAVQHETNPFPILG
jgi:hypothetical protein